MFLLEGVSWHCLRWLLRGAGGRKRHSPGAPSRHQSGQHPGCRAAQETRGPRALLGSLALSRRCRRRLQACEGLCWDQLSGSQAGSSLWLQAFRPACSLSEVRVQQSSSTFNASPSGATRKGNKQPGCFEEKVVREQGAAAATGVPR